MNDMVDFVRARLDEDERRVTDHLCVNCGHPVLLPPGSAWYTHGGGRTNARGEWERTWEGRRCPRLLAGAEPVQNPARVLREAEAKRHLIARYERALAVGGQSISGFVNGQDNGYLQACLDAIRDAAEVWDSHEDYQETWKP